MKSFVRSLALSAVGVGLALSLSASGLSGCAKVQDNGGDPGSTGGRAGGGTGGGGPPPQCNGFTELRLEPGSQDIQLMPVGTALEGMGTIKATAIIDGAEQDYTNRVLWNSSAASATYFNTPAVGSVKVIGPGTYTITAMACEKMATATLHANYTGSMMGPGFKGNPTDFDGNAATNASIKYPLDGALFPSNLTPITVQVTKPGAQTSAKLMFTGDGLDLTYYEACATGAPGTGCYVELPAGLITLFVAASQAQDMKLKVRLAGGSLVESDEIKVAWTDVKLSGGLYYWTTITEDTVTNPAYMGYKFPLEQTPPPRGTAVMRYNLATNEPAKPEVVWTDAGPAKVTPQFTTDIKSTATRFPGSPPALASGDPKHKATNDAGQTWGEGTCIGCHTITNDGRIMAMSIGGSAPGDLMMLDIATLSMAMMDETANGGDTNGPQNLIKRYRKPDFASATTFSDDGSAMVSMYRGKFATSTGYLWAPMTAPSPTAALAFTTTPLVLKGAGGENVTDAFWGTLDIADATKPTKFVFTSYKATDASLLGGKPNPNGDVKNKGRILMATATNTTVNDDAQVLVDRTPNMSTYYPALSSDTEWVVFNKSDCAGPMNPGGYGTDPCDGYDDISAKLWFIKSEVGASPTELKRANGADANSGNSWPRFSPNVGQFRGKKLYFVAFSSRRPYGLQVNQAGIATSFPQLWLAGVSPEGELVGDPSYPPFWLPGQNLAQKSPTGNHVPQWVKEFVLIPG